MSINLNIKLDGVEELILSSSADMSYSIETVELAITGENMYSNESQSDIFELVSILGEEYIDYIEWNVDCGSVYFNEMMNVDFQFCYEEIYTGIAQVIEHVSKKISNCNLQCQEVELKIWVN